MSESLKEELERNISDPLKQIALLSKALSELAQKLDLDTGVGDTDYNDYLQSTTL